MYSDCQTLQESCSYGCKTKIIKIEFNAQLFPFMEINKQINISFREV